jgi:hypothetical protein
MYALRDIGWFLAFIPAAIAVIYGFFYMSKKLLPERISLQSEADIDDLRVVVCLVAVSFISYSICAIGTRDVLWSIQQSSFGPAETVEIISAAGGLTVGIGTSIAAIIKACALFLHAKADVMRAQGAISEIEMRKALLSRNQRKARRLNP